MSWGSRLQGASRVRVPCRMEEERRMAMKPPGPRNQSRSFGFTLIELLVVVSIVGTLVSILMPAASRARTSAKSVVCLSRLRNLGQGLILYSNSNREMLPPARLPKIDDQQWRSRILGGVKYRPTFLAMMGHEVGLKPFNDPKPNRKDIDNEGQPGDRQNYASEQYVCPETPDWLDERNGSYGYNYQFLGNARLVDEKSPTSYKNWPVVISRVKSPSNCVAVADTMGTAASFPLHSRGQYEDNSYRSGQSGRSASALGNEGFNLDPPHVDPEGGEMAGLEESPPLRTAAHARHGTDSNVLWVDAHASPNSLKALGYRVLEDGVVALDGDNRLFSIDRKDTPWTLSQRRSR